MIKVVWEFEEHEWCDKLSRAALEAAVEGVRRPGSIQATRYSTLKKYRVPHQLTIAAGPDGIWRIVEEGGKSRP